MILVFLVACHCSRDEEFRCILRSILASCAQCLLAWRPCAHTLTEVCAEYSPRSVSVSPHIRCSCRTTDYIFGVLQSCHGLDLITGRAKPTMRGSCISWVQNDSPGGTSNTISVTLHKWRHLNAVHKPPRGQANTCMWFHRFRRDFLSSQIATSAA